MPLARIVTRFPESSLAASEYLRSRGYTVEIVDPGDFRVTPAVLELKLGRCTPDEALLRAQEALREVETRKADEPVSVLNPDTEEQGEAIAYDIAGRPVQFAERRKAPNTFRGALLSLLKRAWEDTGSRLPDALSSLGLSGSTPKVTDAGPSSAIAAEPPAATQIVPSQSSIEADNLARAAAEREAAEREHRARIAARDAEERERIRLQQESVAAAERERQRVVAAAREAELARQREQERVAAQRAAEERVRLQREAEIAAERERQRIAARAAEVARQREQERLAEQRAEERARLQREAEMSAERERLRIASIREAELTRQRERDQQRAAAELAARRGGEKALVKDANLAGERQRMLSAAGSAYEPSVNARGREGLRTYTVRPQPVQEHHPYRRRKTDLPPAAWDRRLNPVREREWKKAFAAAGAIAILAAAGIIAFANRRPASPLSPEDINRSEAIEQQAPFGSATIAPANPAPVVAPQSPKPAPAMVPTIQKPAPTHPAVNHSAAVPRRPTNSTTGGRLRRLAPEENQVAEDQVVVRHFQKQQPVLKSSARSGGIKQISDLN